ncbi:hypothetical protein [Massilia sp. 9I]|uniref:hypothetical protein n=1 Tax=Massilia sp. 9I TaxID=2653152 RepID=UPI0012EFCC12|nr:hypothetical protein [Massilia sp. 9I]VXC56402.1 conserved hypothetical protein [Massilia sp. 9I]
MGEARRRGNRSERIDKMRQEFGVKAISEARFNAYVSWSRLPPARMISTELEWYADQNERVLGVVSVDHTDRDFAFVALGRDEKGRFRTVDVETSFSSLGDARRKLFHALQKLSSSGDETFPQGGADRGGVDLFAPVHGEEKLHKAFKLVAEHPSWSPAKAILSEMMNHYVDVDGNFVEQFQSEGFDSRLWELYLYAFLLEEGLYVERPDPAPDFVVRLGRKKVFIEAVTVNPTDGEKPPTEEHGVVVRSQEEIAKLLEGKMPIKFGSALYSKLNRKTPYWTLPDVANHPLIFAIADFHEPQSMMWSSSALFRYLYGVSHDFSKDEHGQLLISSLKIEKHQHNGKEIPSGFFFLPNAENVSAVLFSSTGTLSKFNRMGRLAGFGVPNIIMTRYGLYHDHDPNAALPKPFVRTIMEGQTTETWAEGMSMFHNPNAKHPVDPDLFPGIAHHWFEEGLIKSTIPPFHPYSSMTMNVLVTDKEEDLADKEGTSVTPPIE